MKTSQKLSIQLEGSNYSGQRTITNSSGQVTQTITYEDLSLTDPLVYEFSEDTDHEAVQSTMEANAEQLLAELVEKSRLTGRSYGFKRHGLS